MTTKLSKTQHYQYNNEDGIEVEVSLKYHVPVPKCFDDRSKEFADRQYELCRHALNMEIIANRHLFELMRTDMHFMMDMCDAFDTEKHDIYKVG